MLREGKFEAHNPGKSRESYKNQDFIYFHTLTRHPQNANNDIISRPNSRPKLPLPKNGKGNYKMPREGTGNLRLVFPGITGNRISRSPLPLSHATSPILQCHIFLPPYPTHGHGGHIHVLDLKFKIF